MFVNLTDVLTNEDRVISMQAEAQIEEVSVGGEKYSVLASSPISFVFTNTGKGRARIEGKAAFTFSAACDRCLKPVEEKREMIRRTKTLTREEAVRRIRERRGESFWQRDGG